LLSDVFTRCGWSKVNATPNARTARPLVTARRRRLNGQKFKKSYIDEKYSVEEAEKKYAEWDKLMQQLFIRRK
jgi:hypothetical protein